MFNPWAQYKERRNKQMNHFVPKNKRWVSQKVTTNLIYDTYWRWISYYRRWHWINQQWNQKKVLQKTNMLIISHNKHARKWQGLYVLIISQLDESRTNNQLNHHLSHIHQAKHSYHVWMKSRRHNGMRKCISNQTLCGWNKMPDHLS